MNLGAWMQNLIERVTYFTTWTNTNKQPVSIWLGAFTFPSSFLTSVLQVHKSKQSIYYRQSNSLLRAYYSYYSLSFTLQNESKQFSMQIDILNWEFEPISTPLSDLIVPPNVHNI